MADGTNVIELKQGAHPAQLEQNQQAILLNAARYATIRKIALLSSEEQAVVHEAMAQAMRAVQEPTLTAQTFDKAIDVARAILNVRPTPSEAA